MSFTIKPFYEEHAEHPAFKELPEQCSTATGALNWIDYLCGQYDLDPSFFSITEWDDGSVDAYGVPDIIRQGNAETFQREVAFTLDDGTEITARVPEDMFVGACECRPLPVGDRTCFRVMVSGVDDCPVHGFGEGAS